MRCIELVITDHLILRRGLIILERMVRKLEDGARVEIADVSAVLKFLRAFGDEYHQAMEEQFLFPALAGAAPQRSALSRMILEHSEERVAVAGIESALRSKSGTHFARSSRQLLVLLRDHIKREDTLLRQLPETSLTKEQDDMVVAEFMKHRLPPGTYLNFSRMEWKYTPEPQLDPRNPAGGFARAQIGVGR